jgi:N-acyl-D-amino-acid deacylase
MFDVIIENGRIIDGASNPWFKADIGVKDGRIAAVCDLKGREGKRRIDARGLTVCPGFIDIHCHSDALLFVEPKEKGKILQGVTTETIGNCGMSPMPVVERNLELLKKYVSSIFARIELEWNWRGVGEFLVAVERRRTITNIAALVGHGTVRIAAMGFENRDPDARELQDMKTMVAESLDEGAFGMSSGLIYPPGLFSRTPEMIELCKVAAGRGGIYTTHMRGETDMVIDSVRESILVGEHSGAAVEISHHKTAGRDNWGKSVESLGLIDQARQRGVDVTCDVYPYIAASTILGALLPPWVHEGGVEKLLERLRVAGNRRRIADEMASGLPGWENYVKASGWENIIIASCGRNEDCEGKSIADIAASRGISPADAVCDLMIEEKADVLMVIFMMCEDDVARIMQHPAVMIASDAIPSAGKPHPRYFGTFPRVLAKYVREDKVLSLPEAVRKMTSMPAQRLGIRDRGLLKEGMWADITIFDPDSVEDKATYMNPQQHAAGIEYVMVNGQIAVEGGKYTGALAGKVLRKGRS